MKQTKALRPVVLSYGIPVLLMIALSVLTLFAASFVQQTEKKVALFSSVAVLAIACTPHFRRRLRERCSIFFFLVTAYVVWAGISTLYAYAPKLALSEFSRILAAYAVFLAVFSFTRQEMLPKAAGVLCGATSLLSLLHLDAASVGLIGPTVMGWFQSWTGGYIPNEAGVDTYGYNVLTNRLYGLFGNSNTMACMCAIGIFLALYLLLQAKGVKRLLPCGALVLNSVTFLLCISLGATAALGLTVLLVLVLLHGANNRMTFLMVVLETLMVSGIVTIFSINRLGPDAPGNGLVLLFCLIGWAALYGLDHLLRPRLVDVLCRKVKALCIGLIVLAVLAIIFGIVVFTQTVPVTLTGTENLHKRFYPGAGSCEITLQVDGAAQIQVNSASQPEILRETSTQLLNVPYEGTVTVEIPENTMEVQLNIWPQNGGTVTVHKIQYTGTEHSGELVPGYRWIPKDILQRLQGLTTNHSAMQRMVFMQDGLKLWKQTPLQGRGLGGFENGVSSVQNFYYETKYAHNHYVQLLSDLGLVGLCIFVALLAFAFKSLWAMRYEKRDQGIFIGLLGAVLMFTIHGAIELSPSVAEVLIYAFGVFALLALMSSPSKSLRPYGATMAIMTSIAVVLLSGVYTFLLLQNARAASIAQRETITTDDLVECAQIDVFEGDDYRLTYVVSSMNLYDDATYIQADQYAAELQAGNSNSVGPYLTNYYLHRGEYEKAAAASDKFLQYTRANPESWNTQFHTFEDALLFSTDMDMAEKIAQITLDTYADFLQVNEQQMDELPLDDQNTCYLTKLLSPEGSLVERMDNLMYDSRYAPDSNGDGCADNVSVLQGEVQWQQDSSFIAIGDAILQYRIVTRQPGTFELTVVTDTPEQVVVGLENYTTEYSNAENSVTIRFQITDEAANDVLNFRVIPSAGCSIERVTGQWVSN